MENEYRVIFQSFCEHCIRLKEFELHHIHYSVYLCKRGHTHSDVIHPSKIPFLLKNIKDDSVRTALIKACYIFILAHERDRQIDEILNDE